MQVDLDLVYGSSNWQETLKFHANVDNRDKLTMEPFPDEKVLAEFSWLAYSDDDMVQFLPDGWELLTTAQNNSWRNGYFGFAAWNRLDQHVVVAHRGTDPMNLGAIWIDGKGVYCNRYTNHMCSAITFADDIKEEILKSNKENHNHLVLSFTGHSLGGWLAEVTTLSVKNLKIKYNDKGRRSGFCASSGEGLHAHCLALDSPGVEDMMIKICRDYEIRYNPSMFTEQLDITNFLSDPNMVNSTGFHVGDIQHIPMKDFDLSSDTKKASLFHNLDAHELDSFIIAIFDGRARYVVQNWPQGLSERKEYQELMKRKETKDGSDPSSNNYRYEKWLGDTCHLGVFSMEELKFVKNISFFHSNIIKLTEFENFLSSQNLDQLCFPRFKIDERRKTITSGSRVDLRKVIKHTKLLFRWFPTETVEAVNKQNGSIKVALLYMAGLTYLHTLHDFLDFEDTLGLNTFLENSEQRVLLIDTMNTKFEAARLHNILLKIKISPSNKIYLKDNNYHTNLAWNNMTDIANMIDIEALNESVTIDNLLVLEFSSPTTLSNKEVFKKLLTNLTRYSHKKLVIIFCQHFESKLFDDYKLTVETKPSKAFELSDLTPTSREEILARNIIALGEEPLSLNALLGDDCTSTDTQVQNQINQLIAPILKELAINPHFIVKIPNKLPRLCDLDALYSKGNKPVTKEILIALLKRSGADGPLLVISDPEQLSQDYWEKVEVARGRIFTSEDDGQELFLKTCRQEPARVIYWLNLCEEGFTLSEVYNSSLYMPRKFHTRCVVKSMNKFVRFDGKKDVFIFNDAEDKPSFIRSFDLPGEIEQIFITKDIFKLKTERIIEDESLNKHYFKKVDIDGTPCLVWKYSHGSLDGLRPFITRDYSDPLEEAAFSNMRKKITIIADDPGMGKTTSLTQISELIQDSWVLRIDHSQLTALDKLPLKPGRLSVTKCLIQASNLSTDNVLLRSLLQHCLQSDSSRKVCILVDAFDEIIEEKTKDNMLKLLKYLKKSTKCTTIITTRVHLQERLENELSEFSTVFEKMTEKEQDDYMVKSWLPHLALEHGESDETILRQFAKGLREEMKRMLGKDVTNFMGIPLQIRMLVEVFLPQAMLYLEQAQSVSKITNLFDFYKQFIEAKKSIFFEQKTNLVKVLQPTILSDTVNNIIEKHRVLAFQSIDPKFAAEYFTKTISYQEMKDISGLGLIRGKLDRTFPFIHRTFAEYFCADFFVQWLKQGSQEKQTKENLVKNELCIVLLSPDHYIIRKFIETQLHIISPLESLENIPMLYQSWGENRQLLFDYRLKTPLHTAADEQNKHTFAVLLDGLDSRTSEEAYISFIAARDNTGRTALNIALDNGNRDIVQLFMENVESSSYEFHLKAMLATFLDNVQTNSGIFRGLVKEYSLNSQQSTKKSLIRTEQVRKSFVPFMTAVRKNNYRTVQKIFNDMENDTERAYLMIAIDNLGNTAINLAASKKDKTLFKLFAKQGVCMSFDDSGRNPLHFAAQEGHISIVKYLLNQSNETYNSIITINKDNHLYEEATAFNQAGMYEMFSSIKSKDGSTALKLAKQGGHSVIVKELLDGTDIHKWSQEGNEITSLMEAARNGNLEEVDFLLNNGADLNPRNVYGGSALHMAAANGHFATVQKLLEKGANIETKDNDGWTALMTAASNGHSEVVELLLLNKANFNSRDEYGNTALLLASDQVTVKKLLDEGADIEATNNEGRTALMLAASNGNLEFVELLLSNDADLNSRPENGFPVLHLAVMNGHYAIVHKLLEKGADIHIKSNRGNTVLMVAAGNGYLEVVKHLLSKGACINEKGDKGWVAINWAAARGHLEAVELLLQNGADLNSGDKDGDTPLLQAASNGETEMVAFLLKHDVDVNTQRHDGRTALSKAANYGHVNVVEVLLKHKADVFLQDKDGKTAISWAEEKGHQEVVDLLRNHQKANPME